jgi:hypothetical protein
MHQPNTLKTATGVADPVIIRLTTGAAHIVLLAADASWEKEGMIHLNEVRWARGVRSVKRLLRMPGTIETGNCEKMRIRKTPRDVWAALPGEVSMRVPADAHGFGMTNLSQVQYEAFKTASPRRLLQAAHLMIRRPRKRPLAKAAAALHRLRYAVRAILMAKVSA